MHNMQLGPRALVPPCVLGHDGHIRRHDLEWVGRIEAMNWLVSGSGYGPIILERRLVQRGRSVLNWIFFLLSWGVLVYGFMAILSLTIPPLLPYVSLFTLNPRTFAIDNW